MFSMGCHSGLAVSDATVGAGAAAADDLPAAITARGAVYVASTGFGYGDQVSVGLQERLMTLFAAQLDGAVSLGDALRNAKQQYFWQPGPLRRLRREGAAEHDLVRLADVRRRHAASGSSVRRHRTVDTGPGSAGLCRRHLRPESSLHRASPAPSVGGSKPTPAPGRSCRRSPQAGRRSLVPSSTSPAAPATARCCRPRRGRHDGLHTDRSSPTSTPPSVGRRSTTPPASRKRSTPSPPSRLGWPASRLSSDTKV